MPNNKKITVDQLNEVVQDFAAKNDERFQQQEQGKGLSTNDYDNTAKQKLDGIGDGSTSAKGLVQLSSATNSTDEDKAATPAAVKSAYDLANGKQSPQTTLNGYGIQDAYTKTEVDNKIAAAASSSYHAGGSLAPTAVSADLLVAANDSKVYNLSGKLTLDATTAALFVDGETGDVIPAGTNIVVVNSGTAETPSYKFDKMAGFVDLSDYALNADVEAASAADIQAIKAGIYAEDEGE